MQIASIGMDLGKTTFHLVALDERGKVVIKQKFSRRSGSAPPTAVGDMGGRWTAFREGRHLW